MRRLLSFFALLLFAAAAQAENIRGTILIKRKLTKRSVTSAVSMYERGPGVELGRDTNDDPLAFERSRVVIWVEGPGPADHRTLPGPERAAMQQAGRRFLPDLVVITVGATVSFPNMDPIFHNVFSLSKPQLFDLGNYPKGDTRVVKFAKPGIVFVNCHLHPNMSGVVVVTPNSRHAQADREGKFELKDLPPGDYIVVAWHKAAGMFRKAVHVGAGSDSDVEFFIPLAEERPK